MKTKVLIVISNMEFGGAQRQIVELVNNIDQSKFEIHVCSLSLYAPLAELFNNHVHFHIVNKQAKFDFSVVFKLAKLIKKYKFNVVHSFLFDAEIATRLAAKLSKINIKIIGSERNTNYTLKPIQKFAYNLTKNFVDIIIANSESGAKHNAMLTKQPKQKYHVIYNGVDTNRFSPKNKHEIRSKLGIEANCKLIGMFASFKEQKNHPFLIEALNEVKKQGRDFKLLLVGDTLYGGMHGSADYSSKIKLQIESSNFAKDTIFLGNRDDIEDIYPACDFTILPSLFEGTPNVLLESMSCGVPVIATRISDNDKIIKDGFSGGIVELNDIKELSEKIKLFLEKEDELKKMSINSRKIMEDRFSSIKLAENTQKIYLY